VPSGDGDNVPAELWRALGHIDEERLAAANELIGRAADIVADALAGSATEQTDELKDTLGDAHDHGVDAMRMLGQGREKITGYIADLAAGRAATPARKNTASTKTAAESVPGSQKPKPEKPAVDTTYIDRTYKNIEKEVAETWRKMQAGEEVDEQVAESMPSSIYALLQHALSAGDIPKAESYLAIMRGLKRKYDFAAACYAIGTENAFKVLREEMAADQQQRVKEYVRIMEEEPAKGLLGLLTKGLPDLMKSVIIECRNRGISADVWINRYSINNDEKWVRRWQYYQPVSEHFTALSATPVGDQQGVEKLADDYLADETQEGHVVHAQLRGVIKHIKDPGLKERLLRRYMAEERGALYDVQALYDHRSVGMHMLGQPSCTAEMVDDFTLSIDRILADMVQTGEYSEMKAKMFKLEWQLHVAHTYSRKPPAETVQLVESKIKAILDSDMPANVRVGKTDIGEDIKNLITKRSAVNAVGAIMVQLAKQCAIQGDFASAAAYAAVADRHLYAGAGTKVCLYSVYNSEDLKYFQPDDLEAMMSDVKARQIKLADALASGDTGVLAAEVRAAISSPKPEGYEDKNVDTFVVAALDRLVAADPKQGMALAKAAMERLRNYEISGDYWELSRILIENGDTGEIVAAYNLIERSFKDKPASMIGARLWLISTAQKAGRAKGN